MLLTITQNLPKTKYFHEFNQSFTQPDKHNTANLICPSFNVEHSVREEEVVKTISSTDDVLKIKNMCDD